MPTKDGARSTAESSSGKKLVLTTYRSFDRTGRLTDTYTRSATGKLLSSLTYAYDENGNPTSRKTLGGEQRYAYDQLDRLTSVTFANNSGGVNTDTYAYDPVSNRTAKNGKPYAYNANDQLIASPGATYSYDPQGRRTAKTTITAGESIHTQTYQWNSLDQLTSATAQTGGEVSFTYDAQGRLARAATGAFTRTFNYALSDSPVRTASALTGIGGVTRQEQSLYGPTGLIEERANDAAPTYPQLDGQGTILSRVQESGKALDAPELDPWGVPVEPDQQAPNLMGQKSTGFLGGAGRIDIPGSELTKLGARYYDAESGSFISTDPVVGDAGEPVRRVSYLYAFASPASNTDSSGRSVGEFLCSPLFSPECAKAKHVIAPAAEGAQDFYREIANDPTRPDWLRDLARLGNVLSSAANCDNFGTSVFGLLAFGAGTVAVKSATSADKLVATVAALAMKARSEREFLKLVARYYGHLANFERTQKIASLVWKTVKLLFRHIPN